MSGKRGSSVYDLFKGKLTFTDEPLWFRLLISILIIAFFIAMAWP